MQFLLSLENNEINLVVTTAITITTITVQSLQFLEKYKSRIVNNINRAVSLFISYFFKSYKIDALATLSQPLTGSNSLKISEFLRLVLLLSCLFYGLSTICGLFRAETNFGLYEYIFVRVNIVLTITLE